VLKLNSVEPLFVRCELAETHMGVCISGPVRPACFFLFSFPFFGGIYGGVPGTKWAYSLSLSFSLFCILRCFFLLDAFWAEPILLGCFGGGDLGQGWLWVNIMTAWDLAMDKSIVKLGG